MPAATLVGLYQFENPSNLGLDSSGQHNDLIGLGTGGSATSGEYGGGLLLGGSEGLTTSTGDVPGGFPVNNSSYTISSWFKTSSTGALGIIGWGNYGTTDQVTALRLDGSGGFSHYWWANDLVVSATTADNQFHNVTVSFDGTTRILYFDGALLGQDTPSGHNAAAANFALGRTNGGEDFLGVLDNVAVFDGALSAPEIATISTNDFSAFGVSSSVPEPATCWTAALAASVLLLRSRYRR